MTVVAMKIPPKTVAQKYRRQDIRVTFIPATDNNPAGWAWDAEITRRYKFSGTASSEQAAIKAARLKVDTFGETK